MDVPLAMISMQWFFSVYLTDFAAETALQVIIILNINIIIIIIINIIIIIIIIIIYIIFVVDTVISMQWFLLTTTTTTTTTTNNNNNNNNQVLDHMFLYQNDRSVYLTALSILQLRQQEILNCKSGVEILEVYIYIYN